MKNYREYDWMFQKYVNEKLTMKQISEIANINPHTVWENLLRLGIKRRRTGAKWTDETRAKILPKLKDRKPMLGKAHSETTKKKMSKSRIGAGNGNWKGGITFNSRKFRKSNEYRLWRKQVLERDNNLCQYNNCGVKTNIAHHIKPAKEYPELRIVLENGMTICDKHHKQIHKELRNERLKN